MKESYMVKPKAKIVQLLLILWIVLVSCNNNLNTSPLKTPTYLPVSPTTVLHPIVSPTQTEAVTITPSPQPTLTKDEARGIIGELLAKNANCTKPCFWGFSPATVVEDAKVYDYFTFLHEKPRTIKENGNIQYIASIGYKERIGISTTFTFDEKHHALLNIYTTIGGLYYPEIVDKDWEAFRPETIMKTYGKPSSIEFFLSFPTEPTTDQTIGYDFQFRYESEKFVIDYTGQRTFDQPKLRICPLKDPIIESVYLFLGDNLKIKPSNGKTLQEVSSLDIDDFYTAMLGNKNDACFYLDRDAFN